MIAAWMAYALVAGAFFGAAAWTVERLLRNHRRPSRFVWLGGMLLSTFWPVWTLARPKPEGPVTGPPAGTSLVPLEPLTLQVGSMSVWASLDRPLIALWVVSSSALLLLGLALLLRTRNLRKRCRGGEDGGREVLFSEELGPAVVGVFKPKIILPRWCEGMEEAGLRLILDHESEHLRARDLPLTVFSGVLPVFVPWSLPVWWMWHRLRIAAEGDCDLRVLKNNPGSSRTYMELLLEVGQRFPTGWAAAQTAAQGNRSPGGGIDPHRCRLWSSEAHIGGKRIGTAFGSGPESGGSPGTLEAGPGGHRGAVLHAPLAPARDHEPAGGGACPGTGVPAAS